MKVLTIVLFSIIFLSVNGQEDIHFYRSGENSINLFSKSIKGILFNNISNDELIKMSFKNNSLNNIDLSKSKALYADLNYKDSLYKDSIRDYHILILEPEINPIFLIDVKNEFYFEKLEQINYKTIRIIILPIVNFKGEKLNNLTLNFQEKEEKKIKAKFIDGDINDTYFLAPSVLNDIQVADYKDSNTTFSLGICDFDQDGEISKGVDAVFIGEYGQHFFNISNSKILSSCAYQNDLIIESDNTKYKVIFEIEKKNSAQIFKLKQNIQSDIVKMSYLSDYEVQLFDDSVVNLKRLLKNNKYLFIDFWSIYCLPCIKSFPDLNQLNFMFRDKITILTLLDNGNREDLLRIKNKFNLSFIQGFSTSNLSYNFNVTGYPSNFLFNSDGQLIRINISTQELNKILSK